MIWEALKFIKKPADDQDINIEAEKEPSTNYLDEINQVLDIIKDSSLEYHLTDMSTTILELIINK